MIINSTSHCLAYSMFLDVGNAIRMVLLLLSSSFIYLYIFSFFESDTKNVFGSTPSADQAPGHRQCFCPCPHLASRPPMVPCPCESAVGGLHIHPPRCTPVGPCNRPTTACSTSWRQGTNILAWTSVASRNTFLWTASDRPTWIWADRLNWPSRLLGPHQSIFAQYSVDGRHVWSLLHGLPW